MFFINLTEKWHRKRSMQETKSKMFGQSNGFIPSLFSKYILNRSESLIKKRHYLANNIT